MWIHSAGKWLFLFGSVILMPMWLGFSALMTRPGVSVIPHVLGSFALVFLVPYGVCMVKFGFDTFERWYLPLALLWTQFILATIAAMIAAFRIIEDDGQLAYYVLGGTWIGWLYYLSYCADHVGLHGLNPGERPPVEAMDFFGMGCRKCNATRVEDAEFCWYCGTKLWDGDTEHP